MKIQYFKNLRTLLRYNMIIFPVYVVYFGRKKYPDPINTSLHENKRACSFAIFHPKNNRKACKVYTRFGPTIIYPTTSLPLLLQIIQKVWLLPFTCIRSRCYLYFSCWFTLAQQLVSKAVKCVAVHWCAVHSLYCGHIGYTFFWQVHV